MMFSLNQIKQCIENCKIAGDVQRDSKEFMLAAVMIIFSIDQLQSKNQLIIIKKRKNRFFFINFFTSLRQILFRKVRNFLKSNFWHSKKLISKGLIYHLCHLRNMPNSI